LLGKFQGTEHVVGVGQRQSRLCVRPGEFREPGDAQCAFQQRVRGVYPQMDEIEFGGHGSDSLLREMVRAAAVSVYRSCAAVIRLCRLSPGRSSVLLSSTRLVLLIRVPITSRPPRSLIALASSRKEPAMRLS